VNRDRALLVVNVGFAVLAIVWLLVAIAAVAWEFYHWR
jgi:hypothetical protein